MSFKAVDIRQEKEDFYPLTYLVVFNFLLHTLFIGILKMLDHISKYSSIFKINIAQAKKMNMSIFQFLHWLPDDVGARPRPGHHGAVHQDRQDQVLHRGVTH